MKILKWFVGILGWMLFLLFFLYKNSDAPIVKEQMNAEGMLVFAYGFIWAAVFGYVAWMAYQHHKLTKTMDQLQKAVDASKA